MIDFGVTLFGNLAGPGVVIIPDPVPLPEYPAIGVAGLRVGGDAQPAPGVLLGGATWITTQANGAPKVFVERSPDYIQFTLTDEDGDPIDEAAFTEMRVSLRDQRGLAFNGRDQQNVLNVNGGSWVSPGTFRMTLSSSDLVSRGTQEYQVRELTLEGTHGTGQAWHWVFFFTLRNLRSIS